MSDVDNGGNAVDETTATPEVADGTVAVVTEAQADVDAEPRDPVAELRDALRRAPGDWYVVHSYAGYENKVKTNLESRISSLDMEDFIFQIEVPTQEVTEVKTVSGSRSRVRSSRVTSWFYGIDAGIVVCGAGTPRA